MERFGQNPEFGESMYLLFANSCIGSGPSRSRIRIRLGRKYLRLFDVYCLSCMGHFLCIFNLRNVSLWAHGTGSVPSCCWYRHTNHRRSTERCNRELKYGSTQNRYEANHVFVYTYGKHCSCSGPVSERKMTAPYARRISGITCAYSRPRCSGIWRKYAIYMGKYIFLRCVCDP